MVQWNNVCLAETGQNQLSVQLQCFCCYYSPLSTTRPCLKHFFSRTIVFLFRSIDCMFYVLESWLNLCFITHNLSVSTYYSHSIKIIFHLKQTVTHVRTTFTVRKTQDYNLVKCGFVPAAYSPLLFLTTAQTNWSLWDFVEHFCTYCDLKLL